MFIELVDALRCVAPHADTYLVAAPLEMSGRDIIRGTLGCPVCKAEYEIRDGVAWFDTVDHRALESVYPVSEYEALRCAALLDLQGSNGFAVLSGAWGALAPLLLDSVRVHLVLVNPPRNVLPASGISIIVTGAVVPLAKEKALSFALDDTSARLIGIANAASLVRSGGRLVAPAEVELPPNTQLLVSDERHSVAEVSHPVVIRVELRRAGK